MVQSLKCRHPKALVTSSRVMMGGLQFQIVEKCLCGAGRSRKEYRTGTLGHFTKWGPSLAPKED